MKNLRKYGEEPFSIAVIHGGPGAPGEVAPVARELSSSWGVLEPLQTATSLEGQVQELYDVLKKNGNLPVVLIGYSWGAWLSFIFTAKHPSLVKKLILVGSGPFEKEYAENIMKTRLDRLDDQEKSEVQSLIKSLNDSTIKNKNAIMSQFGKLISKADSYDPLPYEDEMLQVQFDAFQGVWPAADKFRSSGELLSLAKQIECSVVAIHGDYDPHPFSGVKIPLTSALKKFRFILLKKCGHKPWVERMAKDKFYNILKKEVVRK